MTYNHEKFIQDALNSFLAQKANFAFEILVFDDCSQDHTVEIIKEYEKKYPDLIKPILNNVNLNNKPRGFSRYTNGEYIAMCEGDDYWTDPDKLQIQVDFLDQNPDYAICFHKVKRVNENNPANSSVFPENCPDTTYLEDLLEANYIQTNSVMYRNRKIPALNTIALPKDWLSHILHAEFGKIKIINKVMSVYRIHKNSMWGAFKNDLERHKQYGNNEIEFYRYIDHHFKIKYHDLMLENIFSICFRKLSGEQSLLIASTARS